jgi:ribonuclease E
MTFYEAALRVLEAAGQPLTSIEITERSIAQGLLSHVGKTPEQTMLSRLAAMARRARDRRVTVTGPSTFALTEWGLEEDAAALEAMSQPFEHPEEALPPLCPAERHPEPRGENARGAGRTERRRRHEEEGERERRRRFPPVAEVAFELLGEASGPLAPSEVLRLARERQLASDELQPEALLTTLAEENQRRIDAGRRPHFALDSTGALLIERDDAPVAEVQAAFARALDLPLEGGRVAFQQPGLPVVDDTVVHTAKTSVKEARRAMARLLRGQLAALEPRTLEKACVRMLHAVGYREVRVAKRSNHGPLFTARRKDGSLELRYAIRVVRGNGAVDRRMVQDCRRDVGHQSAQVGMLLATGDLRGDARAEALSGGALVLVWSGDGLAEKFLEARTGVRVTQLELFELDRSFFEDVSRDAEEARHRREERRREREAAAPAASDDSAEEAEGSDAEEGEEGEGGGPEEASAASPEAPGDAAAGERRRRRRRRRGRRGRARTEGGGQAEGSAPSASGSESSPQTDAPSPAPPSGGEPPASGG